MENSKVDQTITRNEIGTIAHFVAQKYISLEYGSPRVITQKYIDAYLEAKQAIVDHNANLNHE